MNVGWLYDDTSHVGGAELTQREFRVAAPAGVEVIDCPPGRVTSGLDRYVIHNCVLYPVRDLERIGTAPTTKYWHDVGPHLRPEVLEWLEENATPLCCSPVQAIHMQLDDVDCVPPPVNLARFRAAARARVHGNGERHGAVSVAAWRNFGKAAHRAAEWAQQREQTLDFYGPGTFAPNGSTEVTYDAMPDLLARYQTFVFLPTVLEPFGRLVAEAWAAGCQVITNNLVGAKWWITQDPTALETAAADFWRLVLND